MVVGHLARSGYVSGYVVARVARAWPLCSRPAGRRRGAEAVATVASRLRAANGEVILNPASTVARRLLDLIDLGELVGIAPVQ